jgi:hypothetical protein
LENKLGKYEDKDGDGYVAWYPDPKKPNEAPGAGVDKSVIDTNDADASVNIVSSGASSGGSSSGQFTAGVYPIYIPGKPGTPAKTKSVYEGGGKPRIVEVTPAVPAIPGRVEYLDRNGIKQWLNKNLDSATIKRYQTVLKSLNLLPKNYVVNGKIDLKGQFAGAIIRVIQNQQERGVDAESLDDGISYLKSEYAGSAAGDEPKLPSANVTSPASALADIQEEFSTVFGETAPKEVIVAYRDELKKLELSRTSKTTKIGGVNVGTYGVSEQERKNLMEKYIKQYAASKIAKAELGDKDAINSLQRGTFGIALTNLRGAYSDNGLKITPDSLYKTALDSALDPNKLKSNLDLIRIQAKTIFPALSDKIDAGYTVKQLLSPYLQARATILEEDPDLIDISTLSDVASDTTKGLKSLYDYQISLRNDPKWSYTKNAQDSLSTAALSLAETFGLVG